MQIHDLNTKALTDPAYVAFDDGTDTYKADFKNIIDTAAAEAVADADLTDNTVAFTSGDATKPTAWTAVSVLTSGLTIKVLFNRISTMIKNVRWLYSKLGTTDISSIGGGTVTGAISSLNSKTTESITLSSNVTAISTFNCICEKRGHVVTAYIAFTATEDISTASIVATIPSGFRPPRQFRVVVYKTGGNSTLQLSSSGAISAIGAISNTNSVIGIVSYVL